MKITKLTSGGRVNNIPIDGSTSISADGKYVVYTLIDAGRVSIWVRQISTGSDVQIVPPSDLRNGGTTISNDGEYVYYIGVNSENPGGSLFQVPLLGGTSKKILSGVRSPVAFSPDGSQFAFVRTHPDEMHELMIANVDGTGEHVLSVRKGNDWFAIEGPSWSPDGKWIACGAGTDSGGTYMTILGYSVADGSPRPLTPQKWHGEAKRVIWLKNGSGLVVPVADSNQGSQVWFISQPEGEARRVTNDLNGYGSVSFGVSGDSKTIVTVQSKPSFQIWTSDFGQPPAQSQQITHGESDGNRGVDCSPDEHIIYFTNTGDNIELVSVKFDGSDMRSIIKVSEPASDPFLTADGKTIYFTSMRSGTPHIWRINADGTDLKQVTFGDYADFLPSVSPDGKWLLYCSWRSGTQLLWKVPTEGGEAEQVTKVTSRFGRFSPDGRLVAVVQAVPGGTPPVQIAVISMDGSSATKLIAAPSHFVLGQLAWSPDGRSVILRSDQKGVGNLWSQPIDGSAPKQITNFTSDLISNFALSRDGKRLAISRGNSSLDVVLIKDFH